MDEVIQRPDSSNIKEVRWENNKMYITFNQGGIYEYENIPHKLFEAFKTEPSAGKFFHRAIRNNYTGKKIASGFGG